LSLAAAISPKVEYNLHTLVLLLIRFSN